MKKFLSNVITVITFLVVTVVFLGFYGYMLLRPISYQLDYHNVTEYDGGVYEGAMKFNQDNTMVITNTNFNEELSSYYYYKNGYVFYSVAQSLEEYQEEVAWINENFNKAIEMPFYADKINAFELVATENDGYSTVYTCKSTVTFAIVGGIIELLLIGLTLTTYIFYKKFNKK